MPSVHGASILGHHRHFDGGEDASPEKLAANFPADRDGWVRAVKDLGLQFDFISSEQLERGGLAPGKYRVLILPMSVALSAEESKAVEEFVRAGGVVIADAATGVMDEHCGWRPAGALNELFGITSAEPTKRAPGNGGANLEVTAEGSRWGFDAAGLAGITSAENGVRAAPTSRALARAGDSDAVI